MGNYGERCLEIINEIFCSRGNEKKNINILKGLVKNKELKSLNSVVQCLFHIEPFVKDFKSKFNEINRREINNYFKNKEECLTYSLKNLLDELLPEKLENREEHEITTIEKSANTAFLSKVIKKINDKFDENHEELISHILSRLHIELNEKENINQNALRKRSGDNKIVAYKNFYDNFEKWNKSIISDYFYGIYYLKYTCNNCGNNLYEFNNYILRSFTLSQVYNYKCQTIENGTKNLSEIKIKDCLSYDERIDKKQSKCKKCNSSTINEQKIIYKSPDILIFIINRYDNQSEFKFLVEEYINIRCFVEKKENIEYELIGIIYIKYNLDETRFKAYCKNYNNNQWIGYEDENIEPKVDLQNIIETGFIPYILFYQSKKK